jgi:20S proteasome subunit beta 3
MSGGIMQYNGSAIVAMAGKNCVAIAADTRYGVRQLQTVQCQRQKTFKMTDQCFVGLGGLAADVQTLSQELDFRIRIYELKEERQMEPKIVGNLMSHMLYEKRFGPWFCEPVVAGLGKDGQPFMCAFDFIGAMSMAQDFVVGGTASEQLYGVCESFYRDGMDKDELFETVAQCLLSAVDRDCLSGWGGEVHIITPDEIITRKLKGRMD